MKKLARLNLEEPAEKTQKMNDDEADSVVEGVMYYLSKSNTFVWPGSR